MQLNRASLAVAALLAGVMSTPVHAADAEADDAAQPTGWDWTGFYAGLGVSVGEVRAVPDTLEGVAIIDGVEFSSEVGASPFAGLQVFAGYALQTGPLVLGLEGEIDLGRPVGLGGFDPVSGDTEFPDFCPDPEPGFCGVQGVVGALDLLGRARATLGVEVHPNAVVFFSGGLSLADATLAGIFSEQHVVSGGISSRQVALNTTAPQTERLLGGNLGIGGQLAVTDNIFIRGEIIHDFFHFRGFEGGPFIIEQLINLTPEPAIAESLVVLDEGASFGQTSARISVGASF